MFQDYLDDLWNGDRIELRIFVTGKGPDTKFFLIKRLGDEFTIKIRKYPLVSVYQWKKL